LAESLLTPVVCADGQEEVARLVSLEQRVDSWMESFLPVRFAVSCITSAHVSKRHELLAIHVLASLQHLDGHRRVMIVMQADVVRIDVFSLQQLAEVGGGVGDAVLFGNTLLRRFVDVSGSDYLCSVYLCILAEMHCTNLPHAYHPKPYRLHRASPVSYT
jgi:hypothetical protein